MAATSEVASNRSTSPRLTLSSGAREYGIVLVFLAMFVGLSVASDAFLTERNLLNVLDQSATVGIIAVAATLCIISGVFDLSVAAIFAVAAVLSVKLAISVDPIVGLLAGPLIGGALGVGNGLVVHYLRINSFIATLASSTLFRGIAILASGGAIVSVSGESYGVLGTHELLSAKLTVFFFLAWAVVAGLVLWRTKLGRYIYAVGGNAEAARLSGVRVGLVRGTTLAISGMAAGLAGVLEASRTSSADPSMGTGLELSAIAAAVVGGTSIMGGEGAVWRAVIGVLILAMIGNGFVLLEIDSTYQMIVQGALIMAAVGADQLLRRRDV